MTTHIPTLVEHAYQEIKKDIILGVLSPGQNLNISEISNLLGISPTPIKEALNRLAAENFVQIMPRKGMIVNILSTKSILEYVQTRLMFELFVADIAIKNIKEHHEIDNQMKQSIESIKNIGIDDLSSLLNSEQLFHNSYISLCENECIIKMYKNLHAVLISHYYFSVYKNQINPNRKKEVIEEHKRIYDALHQNNSDNLKAIITAHIERLEPELIKP